MAIYAPGTQIGSYEIVSRPMMGGMVDVVYFALDHAVKYWTFAKIDGLHSLAKDIKLFRE